MEFYKRLKLEIRWKVFSGPNVKYSRYTLKPFLYSKNLSIRIEETQILVAVHNSFQEFYNYHLPKATTYSIPTLPVCEVRVKRINGRTTDNGLVETRRVSGFLRNHRSFEFEEASTATKNTNAQLLRESATFILQDTHMNGNGNAVRKRTEKGSYNCIYVLYITHSIPTSNSKLEFLYVSILTTLSIQKNMKIRMNGYCRYVKVISERHLSCHFDYHSMQ